MAIDTSAMPQSRRALLAGGLAGLAAAVAAAIGRPAPASAAAGSTMIIGSEINNAGSANTQLLTNSNVVAFKLLQNGPGTALMGYATPATGATRGVYGRSDSPNGFGVQARNAGAAGTGAAIQAFGVNNVGVDASTDNVNVAAVRGVNNAVGVGSTGVYGEAFIGHGVEGVSTHSAGVYGSSQSEVGVHGISATIEAGVRGDSNSGPGVLGVSVAGYGVQGESGSYYGVSGVSTTGVGVIGYSSSGYAGYFDARVRITQYVDINEMTAPGAPGANIGRLFMRDNGSGKTQLCVIFPTGAIQVLSTQP